MWAGAHDTRFAMVIASCSGEGGAALSRRNYGETIAHLTAPTRYPYQFAANYAKFAANVNALPVDAHMLIALIAPRPVFLQTGDGDGWSDPKGEFLAAVAAEPVYRLLGKQGLGAKEMPAAGQAIMGTIGYRMHARRTRHAAGRLGVFPDVHGKASPAEVAFGAQAGAQSSCASFSHANNACGHASDVLPLLTIPKPWPPEE